jgi:hypothetical protein
MNADPEGRLILKLLHERQHRGRLGGVRVETLIEGVAGKPYSSLVRRRTGGKRFDPGHSQHLAVDGRSLEHHPGLMSVSEVAVDEILHAVVGPSWQQCHRHGVSLVALGFEGHANFSVDFVVIRAGVRLGVVEVGAGDELRQKYYCANRATKRRFLNSLGLPLFECDLPPSSWHKRFATLRSCAEWVLQLLGNPRAVQDWEIDKGLSAHVHAQADAIVAMSRDDFDAWLRRHGLLGKSVDEYYRRRPALLLLDADTRRTPPRGSLPAWMRREGVSGRFDLMGRSPVGKGSRYAKTQAPDFALFTDYAIARGTAQAGGFRTRDDYLCRSKAFDPRLPSDPEVTFATEFARDGWPGYLGSGAANHELVGLVGASGLRRVLKIGHRRVKDLLAACPPETRKARPRADGEELYVRPTDAVEAAIRVGVLVPGQAANALADLHRVARAS